jgi:hypothetical protein
MHTGVKRNLSAQGHYSTKNRPPFPVAHKVGRASEGIGYSRRVIVESAQLCSNAKWPEAPTRLKGIRQHHASPTPGLSRASRNTTLGVISYASTEPKPPAIRHKEMTVVETEAELGTYNGITTDGD